MNDVKRLVVCLAVLTVVGGMTLQSDLSEGASSGAPPRVSDLRFEPAQPETGEEVKLFLKLNNAIRAELRWSVNDREVELTDYNGVDDHVVFKKSLKAGDTLKVSITPYSDMGDEGTSVEKTLTISNSPPLLKLLKQELKGLTYTARVEIEDPENKTVTLSLEGPEGMKIDQKGNIKWKMKRGTKGKFPIRVIAKDEEGAQAVLSYNVTIRRSP